jgi:ribosomal protein S18 acetylase RimI-like enzyme
MKIRSAVASEYDALCDLFDEVDHIHREGLPFMFRKADGPARSRQRVLRLIDGSDSAILVTDRNGSLAGLVVVMLMPNSTNPLHNPRSVVEIVTLIVRKSDRRQGMGKPLLAAAVSWAEQQKAEYLEAFVYAFNDKAFLAYENAGFNLLAQRLSRPVGGLD